MDKIEFMKQLETHGFSAVEESGVPIVKIQRDQIQELENFVSEAGYRNSFGYRITEV